MARHDALRFTFFHQRTLVLDVQDKQQIMIFKSQGVMARHDTSRFENHNFLLVFDIYNKSALMENVNRMVSWRARAPGALKIANCCLSWTSKTECVDGVFKNKRASWGARAPSDTQIANCCLS